MLILHVIRVRAVYRHVAGPLFFVAVTPYCYRHKGIALPLAVFYGLFPDSDADGILGRLFRIPVVYVDVILFYADLLQEARYVGELIPVIGLGLNIGFKACPGNLQPKGRKMVIVFFRIGKEEAVRIIVLADYVRSLRRM